MGLRHFLAILRSGQLRFRLETYGVYYPALPESRPLWRASPQPLGLFIGGAFAYLRWLRDMKRIANTGEHEWWGTRYPGIDLEGSIRRRETAERGPGATDD